MSIQSTKNGTTRIRVSEPLADDLHERKSRGDSYEDVIRRLIAEDGEEDR